MKILLANHHLVLRAGSELCILELASGLAELGHQIGVFTFYPGPISDEIGRSGVQLFGINDDSAIEAFKPDVLFTQHAPCLSYLGVLRLNAPVLHSMLGTVPAVEAPPVYWGGVAQGLAVSEEVRDLVASSPFGAAVPLRIFRNWFDDRAMSRSTRVRPPDHVRRVAVVTNHLAPGLRADLDALKAKDPLFGWTHFGDPENAVRLTPQTLEPFDVVITIGRSVLLAGALGKPCLLYDVHGCDGWLRAEAIPTLSRRNFSGRVHRHLPSGEELEHLLQVEARSIDVEAVAEALFADFRLSQRLAFLTTLFDEARASGTRLGEHTRPGYGRDGRVYAAAAWAIRDLRERSGTADADLRAAQDAAREAQQRLMIALEDRLRLEARSNTAEATLTSTRAELAAVRESLGMQIISAFKRLPAFYPFYLRAKRLLLDQR
ncbi:MAG: glycosyltransferase family protein [Myxococcaceae bacterium]